MARSAKFKLPLFLRPRKQLRLKQYARRWTVTKEMGKDGRAELQEKRGSDCGKEILDVRHLSYYSPDHSLAWL